MLIGALVRSYGLTDFLPAILKSFSWVDKTVVLNHRFRDVHPVEDKTAQIARQFDTLVIGGENFDQHEVLNHGLTWFKDFDYVFIADNDELITHAGQKTLIEGMAGHDAGQCSIIDYVSLTQRLPQRDHHPIVIVRPSVRFYEVRCFAGNIKAFNDVTIHHFGYAYEDLSWKLEWEKKWEHDGVSKLLGQVRSDCEIPAEIKELISG